MVLRCGGMGAVSSWMCLVAGAWESDMRPWLERQCVEWGLVVVSIPPRKLIRELVVDEGVHPISEHCTRSDRV